MRARARVRVRDLRGHPAGSANDSGVHELIFVSVGAEELPRAEVSELTGVVICHQHIGALVLELELE